ncbi:hypothetical protein RBA16_25425, partial [Mycobacteroides abscessus subsp. massiliense]
QFAAEFAETIGTAVDLLEPGLAPASGEYEHVVFLGDAHAARIDRDRYAQLVDAVDAAGSGVSVHVCLSNAFDVTGAEELDARQWLAFGAAQWLRRSAEARTVD